MKLVAPKRTVLKPIHPNAGVEMAYRQALMGMVNEMCESYLYWIKQSYSAVLSEMAHDASPQMRLNATMKQLGKRWQKNFADVSNTFAEKMASGAYKHADTAFAHSLKKAGFSIKFQPTASMKEALEEHVRENVDLIKSIPMKFHDEVEELVSQSALRGRAMGELTTKLYERFDITRSRAALIARDQNNKATAAFQRSRQLECGITKAIWFHTSASKDPREEHEKWGDEDQVYDIDEGMYSEVDDEYVWPGTAINCLPGASEVEFTDGCKQLWRGWYAGELTVLVTQSGETLEATPNHPVLTNRGWLPIKSVNVGDNVFKVSKQVIDGIEADVECDKTTFAEFFDSAAQLIVPESSTPSANFQFYGDVPNGEVDVIDIHGFLPSEFDAKACKRICEFLLPWTVEAATRFQLTPHAGFQATLHRLLSSTQCDVSGIAALLPLCKGLTASCEDIGFATIADVDSSFEQSWPDSLSGDAEKFSNLQLAQAGFVGSHDIGIREMLCLISRGFPTPDAVGKTRHLRVEAVGMRGFSGHVYNLHNERNWFTSSNLVCHNCGCTSMPVIPGFNDGSEEDE